MSSTTKTFVIFIWFLGAVGIGSCHKAGCANFSWRCSMTLIPVKTKNLTDHIVKLRQKSNPAAGKGGG